MRSRVAVVLIAIAGALAARAMTRWWLSDVPHVMDEFAYLLQAETLASGHLTAPVHLPRAAFAMWFVDDRAATFGIFPPGWPALLAVGVLAGVRAWVNPMFHLATTIVVAAIARRLGGTRAAVIAAAAWAFAPQTLLLASSLMSHTLTAACAATVAYAGVRACTGERSRTAWMGGAALGVAVLTRPLCAVAIAMGLVALLMVARRRSFIGFVVPVLAACVVLGAYNGALTGHATRFPQSAYFDEHAPPVDDEYFRYAPGCNDLGFGKTHGCDYGIKNATHDAANAISNTGDNLRAWGLLVGPVTLGAFGWGIVRAIRRRTRLDRVALATASTALAVVALYALYWYAGTCYGARFYHAGLVGVVVVAAVAASRARRAAIVMGGAWLACGAVAIWGASRELSGPYWGNDDRFARVAASWSGAPAVVMVAFRGADLREPRDYTWTSFLRTPRWRNSVRALGALSLNGPRLDRRVVFAKFHPALADELRTRFPDREMWLYVVEDDRPDTIAPYDAKAFPDEAPPKDNFDAFRVPEH